MYYLNGIQGDRKKTDTPLHVLNGLIYQHFTLVKSFMIYFLWFYGDENVSSPI